MSSLVTLEEMRGIAMEIESTLLEGKVCVVSGIGPGLGRRAAVRLAANGADIAIGARRQSSLDDCATAAKELGRVDVLVNNAFRFDAFQTFEDVDLVQWEKIVGTNVFGSLRMTKAVLPHLHAVGGGSVVMIASMVARQPQPLQGGYATSKGGLLTATRVLAFELGAKNIRVNAVVPGWMKGPSVDIYLSMTAEQRGITEAEVEAELIKPIPIGRIPVDQEVAGAVVFLASDLSSAITGQAIDVNGGEHFN